MFGDFIKLPIGKAEDFFYCWEYSENTEAPFESVLVAEKIYTKDRILKKSISPICSNRTFLVASGEGNLPRIMIAGKFKTLFYYSGNDRLVCYTKETDGRIVESFFPQYNREGRLVGVESSIEGHSFCVKYDERGLPLRGLQFMRRIKVFTLDEYNRPEHIFFEWGPNIRFGYRDY